MAEPLVTMTDLEGRHLIPQVDAWDTPMTELPETIAQPHQLVGYLVGRLLSSEYRVFRQNRRLRQLAGRARLEFAAREAWERNRIRARTATSAASIQTQVK